MLTARQRAEAACRQQDLGSDVCDEFELLFEAAQADARRATLELAIKTLAEMPTSRGWTAYETLLHGQQAVRTLLDDTGKREEPACETCKGARHVRHWCGEAPMCGMDVPCPECVSS